MNQSMICFSAAALLLSGCTTLEPAVPLAPVVDPSEALTYMEAGLKPEKLLFPDYLLPDGFELSQHGRIPETNLVGAGLKSGLGLSSVRSQFSDVIASNGWKTDKMELGKNAFRLLASKRNETLEIRGVQGSGVTRIFILYTPSTPQES